MESVKQRFSKSMAVIFAAVLMAVFMISGSVFAAAPEANSAGKYVMKAGSYTLTFDKATYGSSSSNDITIDVVASEEGDFTYPDYYGPDNDYKTKHLKKDEEFTFKLWRSKFLDETISLVFETVHVHDWDSTTGTCKTCGQACTHDFSGGYDWCDICKWKCTHEKTTVTNYYENYNQGTHRVIGKCDLCGKTGLEIGEENCTWELQSSNKSWNASDGSLKSHEYKCSKCKQTKYEDCSFDTVVSTTSSGPETHTLKTQCKCGNVLINDVSHKWSGNTCSDCGFVRVQPGKIKGLKLKKIKSVKKKRWKKGYWDNGVWRKGYYYNYYACTYKVTFSKVKNAKYYEITYDSDVFIYNPETTKKIKSGAKIKMNLSSKGNTYITLDAVSKTGNKSTYKKNFKYKIK